MQRILILLFLCGCAAAECAITTSALPNGKVGERYSARVETSGCGDNLSLSTADGALPAGVEWSSGGRITGIPSREGWYYTKVAAKGSAGSVSSTFWTEIVPRVIPAATPPPSPGKRHEVKLSWDAPIPTPQSYSVYRANSRGGPYRRIFSGITARNWSDSVAGGATYYYVVTAIVGREESICSQVVKASIP